MEDNSKRRKRRTKVQVEKALFDAIETLVKKNGFTGLKLTDITAQAKIEPNIFYNRYDTLDEFIKVYVRRFDYWLSDSVGIDPERPAIENAQSILEGLIGSLIDNVPMQKLLAWEIETDNATTRATASFRDANSRGMLDYFNGEFTDLDVDFNYSSSLLIAGVYYLILHRDRGTINFIDYSKDSAIEKLIETARKVVQKLYTPEKAQIYSVAKKLFESNISYEIIKNSTGLSDIDLKKIESEL